MGKIFLIISLLPNGNKNGNESHIYPYIYAWTRVGSGQRNRAHAYCRVNYFISNACVRALLEPNVDSIIYYLSHLLGMEMEMEIENTLYIFKFCVASFLCFPLGTQASVPLEHCIFSLNERLNV